MLAPAADADLNGTRGIEHAVQYRLAEWTAMVESAPFINTSSVAMRVDVHEANWPTGANCAQDWVGDRVISPCGKRLYPGHTDTRNERLDVLHALLQAETAAERNIAYICHIQFRHWGDAKRMVEWTDALDVSDRPRAEPRPSAIGNAEVYRHADQRHLQAAEIRQVGYIRSIRCPEQGRNVGIG